MIGVDRMDEDIVLEITRKMGYVVTSPEDQKKYKTLISKMDVWDISKILFFGKTWEQY